MPTREFTIGSTRMADTTDCYIVAEIGHNHQGSVEKCKELCRVAKECGVDAVKLQKRDNRTLYTKAMYDRPYDNPNSFGATYGEHREALEFGRSEYRDVQAYCKELDVALLATTFDIPSADFLAELDMPAYKTASGDLKSIPLLKHVARIGKPMIVSTGGGTLEDIERAYDAIMPINNQLCFLQCTAAYPAAAEDLNLRVITSLRERFPELVIGFSDHENGIAMAVAAFVLGARVCEKHFTLNHTWKGTDHAFSLEPVGMRKLVRDLRRARVALGDGVKAPVPIEHDPLVKMGKGLFASHDLPAGHVLVEEDIAMKSPRLDGALPPYHLDTLLGRTLEQPVKADEHITLKMLTPEHPG